ncbi:TetR/AcrR family transcriptional regulator [Chakrabartyella piscis]|uniref:TetR/AcrR family transcriptional regulator n=1 Tax=Chakrabartyella piscis TaxID=2918914 RepID=UPI00295831F1|nr:TetR/AcrR family transcriptional regulator [Chakrabartyella piscis]
MKIKDLHHETAIKIIECSIELFNEHGYEGTSISDISKKTEMSRGILYHYFKNKDSLYLYCVKKCIDDFRLYIKENTNDLHKGKEAALALLNTQQNFLKIHPQYRVLCYNTLAQRPAHLCDELFEIKKALKEDNALAFEDAFKDVKFGKGVTLNDALRFLTLLQNNAVCALDILSDIENANAQEEAFFRTATIFINGLEQDFETEG